MKEERNVPVWPGIMKFRSHEKKKNPSLERFIYLPIIKRERSRMAPQHCSKNVLGSVPPF